MLASISVEIYKGGAKLNHNRELSVSYNSYRQSTELHAAVQGRHHTVIEHLHLPLLLFSIIISPTLGRHKVGKVLACVIFLLKLFTKWNMEIVTVSARPTWWHEACAYIGPLHNHKVCRVLLSSRRCVAFITRGNSYMTLYSTSSLSTTRTQ